MTHTRSPEAAVSSAPLPTKEAPVRESASSPEREAQPQASGRATKQCAQTSFAPTPAARETVGSDAGFGLDRGDRRFVTVAAIIALSLMSVHWWRIAVWSPAPVRVDRPTAAEYRFVLDINQATWVEWMQIEGVGETLARRIVDNRNEFGLFPDVDSVRRVPGIGVKTLERIRFHAVVRPPAAVETSRRPAER